MVFYLKYRPKKIAELDSSLLVERLGSILKGKLPDKIPHAFLFTGPKGLGKTSTARILAKAINCENRKSSEIEPCNACSSCMSINNGSNLDVLEIDGASNRGIDEIRDLREKIRLSPVHGKKKIYIIDEVHMLTTEAFNALLKTLEEPPDHAFFMLCTTEPQKVPQTILSRCFQIKFNKATDDDLVHSFTRILKGEGIKADKDALYDVARLSDGSFRDGAKILQELSETSKNITTGLIEEKYKTQSIDKYVNDLITSFVKRDAKTGIKLVSRMEQEDVDFKLFTQNLLNVLHSSLVAQVQGEESDLSLEETKKLIEMLVKSHTSIKYAILPQLPLELTIVEWGSIDEVSNFKSQISNKTKSLEIERLDNQKSENQNVQKITPAKPVSTNASGNDKILEDLIDNVKKENFSLAGILRGCKVEKFDNNELILSTSFKFHKERLSDPKIINMLEGYISEMTNKKLKISIA